jgi:hypothetical protein
MSHDATSWARKQTTGNTPAKFLLMMLADHAGSDYTCWPGQEALSKLTEMSERTVRRATDLLVTQGLIRVFYRYRDDNSRRSCKYQLLIDGPGTELPETVDWRRMKQADPDSLTGGPPDTASDTHRSESPEPWTESPVIPCSEPSREPSLLNPGASRNGEVVTGEIVIEEKALFAAPVGADLEVAETPNAGQLTRRWIDYCTENSVKLSTSVIKRYGAGVRQALADGFDDTLIRRALAAMLADRVASRPALFDTYLIRVQQGPELPPERLTAHQADAERRAAAVGTTAAARLYDTLTRDA